MRFQTDLNASLGSQGMAWTVVVIWSDSRWVVECLFSKLHIESGDESVTVLFSEATLSLGKVEQLISRALPQLSAAR